ncbi:MAG: glutamate--cysteine ligase [Actinomycetota bacterium]|nr:glutamate--cysteine ligase [Actinomycetota bacterium]
MQTALMRTVGVEEELLLVDIQTGVPRSVAARVIERAVAQATDSGSQDGGAIEGELQRTMVETQSSVATDLSLVRDELMSWRRRAASAARQANASVAAIATSPMPSDGLISSNARYERMADRFGVIAHDVLTCGCHVHVGVESDDEGVAALDRIRVWLPVILALSANSPFSAGRDSGYASYRSQLWARWPSAGPTDRFGTPQRYHQLLQAMTDSGVLLDDGMVYFDARLSRRYPTVEIRVADVCVDLEDALLVAALCRGLVDTAAAQWRAGQKPPDVATAMLRLATWQAARDGVDGHLLDWSTMRPAPAATGIGQLVDHVRGSLFEHGDLALVEEGLERLGRVGTGATAQRRMLEKTGQLVDVVAQAVRRTDGRE